MDGGQKDVDKKVEVYAVTDCYAIKRKANLKTTFFFITEKRFGFCPKIRKLFYGWSCFATKMDLTADKIEFKFRLKSYCVLFIAEGSILGDAQQQWIGFAHMSTSIVSNKRETSS